MSTTTSAQRAIIDARINTIASEALIGEIPETEARWMILKELFGSDVPRMVAQKNYVTLGLTRQEVQDLADRLQELLERKALDPNFMKLDKLVTSKACGWAYNLCSTAARSEARNMRRPMRDMDSVDPLIAQETSASLSAGTSTVRWHTRAELGYANATEGDVDLLERVTGPDIEELDAIEIEYVRGAAGARGHGRRFVQAEALRKMFKLPELVRPETSLDRAWVLDELTGDEGLALRSAVAMHALIDGVQTLEQRNIDDRLLALWDDYTAGQLETLIGKPAQVAHTLALAASSLLSRPSRDVLATALATIRMTSEGPNWRSFTRDLFDAWIAVECEETSDYDAKSSQEDKDRRHGERMVSAMNWPELAREATRLPKKPLGSTTREVATWMRQLVSNLR